MLGVVQKVFFGPLKNPKNFHLPDLNRREVVAVAPLVIMIFVIGFFPSTFLNRSSQAVSDFHTRNRLVWNESQKDDRAPRLLTNEVLAASSMAGAKDAEMLDKLDEGAPAPKGASTAEPEPVARGGEVDE
jgi:NADH-quinone oxidoreductase subunit M